MTTTVLHLGSLLFVGPLFIGNPPFPKPEAAAKPLGLGFRTKP